VTPPTTDLGPRTKFPRRLGWGSAVLTGTALVGLCASSWFSFAGAATRPLSKTTVVYAFNINPSGDNLIAAPGTKRGVVSAGDESLINDQLTTTHEVAGGYPIVGYDSGTCTFTRVPPDGQPKDARYNMVTENCVATAVLAHGDLTAEGVVTWKAGVPQPATFAVTGGTASFNGAHGSVAITFGKEFKTYTIVLS
jgi:hypothetical protein